MSMAQDECWDSLAPTDRLKLNKFWNAVPSQFSWNQNRAFETYAHRKWDQAVRGAKLSLRREFCEKFELRFPQDNENGCPPDRPPPATIVTQDGDVPITGEWPRP
jgi:hypothetical protein